MQFSSVVICFKILIFVTIDTTARKDHAEQYLL